MRSFSAEKRLKMHIDYINQILRIHISSRAYIKNTADTHTHIGRQQNSFR